MNNINDMIYNLMDTQVPVLFVSLDERGTSGNWGIVNHVIIPDGADKIVCFDYDNDGYLRRVKSHNTNFEDAIVDYSKKVLRDQGAYLKLYGN